MAPTQIYGNEPWQLTPVQVYVSYSTGGRIRFSPSMITRSYSLRSSTNSIKQKEKLSKTYPKHHKLKGVKKPTPIGTKPKSLAGQPEIKMVPILMQQVQQHKNVYYFPK